MTDIEYEIRKELSEIYDNKVKIFFDEYINKHNNDIQYFIHYPLIDIEIESRKGNPTSINCNLIRNNFSIIVKNTYRKWACFDSHNNITQQIYEKYVNEDRDIIKNAWYNTQTLNQINDSNSFAKSKLEEIDTKHYKFISSTVENTWKEELFYYYGEDNKNEFIKEREIIAKKTGNIFYKYINQIDKINALDKNIDKEIMDYAEEKIMMDLSKINNKTKSEVFGNLNNLLYVLSYLYYLSFVNKMYIDFNNMMGKAIPYDSYLIKIDKNDIIEQISSYFKVSSSIIEKIINYLINNGYENILEFPLYEHKNILYTVPSLIMLNDWSFSLVNGHYLKNIQFERREKTISVSTEQKLERVLRKTNNIKYVKEKSYSFLDKQQKIQNSDIDFAILDTKRKKLLIIESKWKDNHYKNNEKNYIKIEDTLNKIYKNQISKHKEFLSDNENFKKLFSGQTELKIDELEIFYLAVDKRNQLHIDSRHMLTEYMLLWLINTNLNDLDLNIENVINEIKKLKTKILYIFTEPSHLINLKHDIVVEMDDIDF